MINKLKHWLTNFLTKEDSTYHILTFIISSILFSSLPIIWFLIFMKEKMIFSYDFFTNGMFGLSIFFFFALLFLFLIGFILVGSISFIIIYLYKRKAHPKHTTLYIAIYLFIINIIMLYFTYLQIKEKELIHVDIFTYEIIFNFFAFGYFGIYIAGKGLHKFIALITFIVIFIWSTITYHQIISAFVEMALYQFRAGGDIPTKIIDYTKKEPIGDGTLILLSPNKIFLQENNTTKVFNRDNIVIKFLQ